MFKHLGNPPVKASYQWGRAKPINSPLPLRAEALSVALYDTLHGLSGHPLCRYPFPSHRQSGYDTNSKYPSTWGTCP